MMLSVENKSDSIQVMLQTKLYKFLLI